MEFGKRWVCKIATCRAVVNREERYNHIRKVHKPEEFFDPLLSDEWE